MSGDTVNLSGTHPGPVYVKSTIYAGVPAAHAAAEALASARAALASMPTDRVPPPQILPAGSRLPHAPNPGFVGRNGELLELARTLKGDGPEAAVFRPACICGLGGAGKTQLAVEFAHRFGRHFAGGVFWIDCADGSGTALDAEMAACGLSGSPELPADYAARPLPEQVRLMATLLQSPLPRLLVLDGCDEEASLVRLRPPHGACRVLVTSRRGEWPSGLGVCAISLGPLRRADSTALLRRFREVSELEAGSAASTDSEEQALDAIAGELGDLALALHLAGGYLREHRDAPWGTPTRFLAALRGAQVLGHPSMRGEAEDLSPTGHARHVGRTFAVSFQRLRPEVEAHAAARRVLAYAACLAPGAPAPRALLRRSLGSGNGEGDAALELAEVALKRLTGLGLLTREPGGSLTVHRLVALFARAEDPDPDATAGQVSSLTADLLAEANITRMPGPGRPLLPHAEHLAGLPCVAGTEREAQLLDAAGRHLMIAGSPQAASRRLERALAIHEAVLGPDHPAVAASLDSLGNTKRALGSLLEARKCQERALAIRQAALGPGHPDVGGSLNSLGLVLRAAGDAAGARACYERALAIREAALGPDHPDTAWSLTNLGVVLRQLRDLEAARACHERALRIREAVLGPDHPDTAWSLTTLGSVLHDMGNLRDALAHHERALAIRQATLGPEHPDVAWTLGATASVFHALGDLAGARDCHQRALVIREAALGSDHREVRWSIIQLSAVLHELGDSEGARAYDARAAEMRASLKD